MDNEKDIRGLLMRVGIDQTFGHYNAPINPNNCDYLYMPIPQSKDSIFRNGMATTYQNLIAPFNAWSLRNNVHLKFPDHLVNENCHLDPDFDHVSYGDQATGRGRRVRELKKGDFIAFFASFMPTEPFKEKLVYALYGIIFVDYVEKLGNLPENQFYKNAHSRIVDQNPEHLVVFGDTAISGRFSRAIPIGEWRNRSYRLTHEILNEWGGVSVKDGYVQRSVNPPWFNNPSKFLKWLERKEIKLCRSNW